MAQRLLQHHPRLRGIQSGHGQLLADGGEEAGRRRYVHDHGVGLALRQGGRQAGVVGRDGQIHLHEFEQGGKAGELLHAGPFGQFDIVEAGANQIAVLVIAEIVATHTNDAALCGQRAVAKSLKQRRHQFAPSQVARAAK